MLSVDELNAATWLSVTGAAATPAATELIADLTQRVEAFEAAGRGKRKTRRRDAGRAKLSAAIGALVAGILRRWGHEEPTAVFRSRKADDFSGSPVGARQFLSAVDALVGLGLIGQSKAIRYQLFDFGEDGSIFGGKAPRYWPTANLLELATQHGVTRSTVRTDFYDVPPKTPPKITKLVQVFDLRQRQQKDRLPLPLSSLGKQGEAIKQDVEAANTFAQQHQVSGCLPPRWYRVFVACPELGGRWQAAGKDGVYQVMPEADRLARITINGEPVAEVDVQASHLSIMHGLLGLQLPDGDPYEVPGIPRSVVKAWITATLGKGSPVRRWSLKAIKRNPELASINPNDVGHSICDRYPFLRAPAKAVAEPAGLVQLARIGSPERLLTHRLMGLEAAALTGAIRYLRTAREVLALPIHDSLMVPQSALRFVAGAFDGAFTHFARTSVRLDVATAPDVARMGP